LRIGQSPASPTESSSELHSLTRLRSGDKTGARVWEPERLLTLRRTVQAPGDLLVSRFGNRWCVGSRSQLGVDAAEAGFGAASGRVGERRYQHTRFDRKRHSQCRCPNASLGRAATCSPCGPRADRPRRREPRPIALLFTCWGSSIYDGQKRV